MIHTYTCKGTTRYRYYVCLKSTKQGAKTCATRTIPSKEIEDFVVGQIATIGQSPELIQKVGETACAQRESRMAKLEAEKVDIERTLRHNARLVAGIFDLPNASARLTEIEAQLRAGELRLGTIQNELASLEKAAVTTPEIAKALGAFHQFFDSMPQVHQARCLSLLLEQVTYDREKGTVAISFWPSGIKVLADEK